MIKILAIDDNQDNLVSIKALISESFPDALILTALTGMEGLDIAQAEDPDVILLDIVMPGMDGFETCKRLKTDKKLSDIPVVFLTALKGDKNSRIQALECGAEAFLPKPIDEVELTAQIRAMVKIRNSNLNKYDEKKHLVRLVEEQTSELKANHIATLNLLEDLRKENDARKYSEEATIETQTLYHSFIEQLPNPVFRKDLAGHFTLVNSEFCKLKGLDKEDLLGKTPMEVADYEIRIHGERGNAIKYALLGENIHELILETGKSFEQEEDYPAADGSMQHLHVIRMPVRNSYGTIVGTQGIMFDITGRKKAELDLKNSYNLLNNLTAQVPGVVYQYRLYPDGNSAFPYSSPGMYDIYEVTPEEVREDASPVFYRIHPEDFNSIVETITESARNQILYHIEFRVNLPKQGVRWRLCDAKPELLPDGSTLWHGIITDITERKLAEKQLQLLSRAVEDSPVTVVITNKEGIIEYANPKFSEVTGYSAAEVLGKNPRILKSGNQTKEFYTGLWDTILSGKEWVGEFQNKKKSGESFWESAIISSIKNNEGEITSFIAVKEDITEKKKLLEALIKAKEKAVESDHLKTSFLNNISHEIRTPFNGILGFLGIIQEGALTDEERDEYIGIINKSAYRLMNTINDIVEISQIQAGQITLKPSKTNIRKLSEELYNRFIADAEQAGLEFTINYSLPDNAEYLSIDSVKLQTVLSIMIGNAIKFTKEGSIQLGIKLADRTEEIEFSVKDTGVGIAESKKNIIFERFRQADGSNTRHFEGSGLGLSIAKAYIEMLGGKILVESEEGKGSTFRFTIPYKGLLKEKIISNTIIKTERAAKEIKELIILIVEDDEGSALLLEMSVRTFCKELIKVKTGVEAVDACRNNPDIDLVFMDIKMPGMDGHEATRQIRQFNTRAVVIAQTAYAMSGDREKAIGAGCNDYISKPIRKDKLVELMKMYF
jgi:PAS domain S-box-containing protein